MVLLLDREFSGPGFSLTHNRIKIQLNYAAYKVNKLCKLHYKIYRKSICLQIRNVIAIHILLYAA